MSLLRKSSNVEKRIEFISEDITKAEDAIKALEEVFETKRQELLTIQEEAQAQALAKAQSAK
jgi:hypothetical protein